MQIKHQKKDNFNRCLNTYHNESRNSNHKYLEILVV